jgi:hypothetical protein
MQEGRRRWVKGLKATGQKAPGGGDFTKSATEKAERAHLHEDRARKANEARGLRNNPAQGRAFCEAARTPFCRDAYVFRNAVDLLG